MRSVTIAFAAVCFVGSAAWAEYKPVPHKPLAPGAVAVTKPGNLDKPGTTYQLMNDITSDRTALFLAKDVTLDLNGYTITYAKGAYEHVANFGFEEGFKHWDTTKAPDAKIQDALGNWPFVGKKICRLPEGQEIVSEYVVLPVADRSYYAMCGVLKNNCKVRITVEDEKGNPVEYEQRIGGRVYKSCPATLKSKLDGGVVYARFRGMPAGKYRIRLKSEEEGGAIVDQVDIRPSLDVGVAVVGSGLAYANYPGVAWSGHVPCLVDYLVKDSYKDLLPSVTTAKGNTKVTIKNGVIRNGFEGIHTWGIMSRGAGGTIVLENVKMVASGVNTNQVYFGDNRAVMRNCRFETDTPFIIERHNLPNCPVAIGKADGSEVSHCEFIGGQGNLYVRGNGAKIHDNLFVNRQRVTNHYAIGVGGSRNIEIYNNRFEPDIGSGITVFRSKDCDIHHNTFKVNASRRSCRFYRGGGTVVGVRITDYNSKKGDPRGCWGNKVRDNKFHVTGMRGGRACAIFYSSGAGKNTISNNEFVIDHKDPDSGSMATGFYVGAADIAGEYLNNTITSNVPAFYIASGYGPAGNALIKDNTFIKGPNAAKDYQPIRIGYWKLLATNIQFRSNKYVGSDFGIQWISTDVPDVKHTLSVWWTLTVKATDAGGKPLAGREVVVADKDGKEVARVKTGDDGTVAVELLEYKGVKSMSKDAPDEKDYASPYTVNVGEAKQSVSLDGNKTVTLKVK